MAVGLQTTDVLVCHCFEVTESEIRRVIDTVDSQSVEDVRRHTAAGDGCTACHCRIRRMLAGLPASCGIYEVCAGCGFAETECACKVA